MRGNLENKLAAHGTKPLGFQGGWVGLEKLTKNNNLDISSHHLVGCFLNNFFVHSVQLLFIFGFSHLPINDNSKIHFYNFCILYLLCISTSVWVLGTLFPGHYHLFGFLTSFSVKNGGKRRESIKKKEQIHTKRGLSTLIWLTPKHWSTPRENSIFLTNGPIKYRHESPW